MAVLTDLADSLSDSILVPHVTLIHPAPQVVSLLPPTISLRISVGLSSFAFSKRPGEISFITQASGSIRGGVQFSEEGAKKGVPVRQGKEHQHELPTRPILLA